MHTLILPCAGRSTRFSISRPKWSLTHPYGEIMLIQSIKGLNLNKYDKIVPIFIKEDLEENNLKEGIIKSFDNLGIDYELVILDERTKSQSETVVKGIEKLNIKGNILIKDCDSYFTCDFGEGDFVYASSLQSLGKINAKSKSYVDIDTNNFIKTIVEKNVIGDLFCCGGYNFSNTEDFIKTYNYLSSFSDGSEEIYISHVIYQQILEGKQFKVKQADNFKDWGTLEDWEEYKKQYKTLFIDIDGVLVENSGEYVGRIWGQTPGIEPNIQYINNLYETGKVRIILTTSRKSSFKKITLNQLEEYNVKYHDIIFDLLHCQRVLINDFSQTNNYPTSVGVNLPRNNNNLKEYLKTNFNQV